MRRAAILRSAQGGTEPRYATGLTWSKSTDSTEVEFYRSWPGGIGLLETMDATFVVSTISKMRFRMCQLSSFIKQWERLAVTVCKNEYFAYKRITKMRPISKFTSWICNKCAFAGSLWKVRNQKLKLICLCCVCTVLRKSRKYWRHNDIGRIPGKCAWTLTRDMSLLKIYDVSFARYCVANISLLVLML